MGAGIHIDIFFMFNRVTVGRSGRESFVSAERACLLIVLLRSHCQAAVHCFVSEPTCELAATSSQTHCQAAVLWFV